MSVQAMSAGGIQEEVRPVYLTDKDKRVIDNLTGWQIGFGISALTLGLGLGILQGLEHAGFDFYSHLEPVIKSYYQGLSIHGVLNALLWTTFFICGFFTFSVTRSLNRPLRYPWVSYLALGLMVAGTLMAAYPLLSNMATVLYTFYPPLMAHWTYYLGLTLVVVGSWTVGYSLYFTYWAWKRENPGVNTPFIALAGLITMVLWQICTLGVAAEILAMLLPWSLGWIDGVDPLLGRTLFWFFGHPLVYFWLLPAYVSWYGMLPAQTNGKMFSEHLARLVFWLFLLFSTPVGFHHQYTDPGIPVGWKFLHTILTFGVGFPSLLTAFTVVASLEVGARIRGGKGYFGWIFKLNWGNASYTAQNLAMILFVFGGIGGMINASYNMNLAVHNTAWIPGHFHLTVGSATTLTFFGICYWLVPYLTGHKLISNTIALIQAWTWFFGMLFMGNAYHTLGLYFSAPRRTMLGAAPYRIAEWNPMLMESLLGVALLFISATAFFFVILFTILNPKKLDNPLEMPVAEPLDPTPAPKWLNDWTPWLAGTLALILLSYGPMLYQLIRDAEFIITGFQPWPR